jgi:3-oxoacyl-[acyl-carrier protein] reductase
MMAIERVPALRPVVLITGATSGLCAGLAERLASLGYRLVLATRRGGGDPAQLLARLHRFDPGASALEFDLADPTAASAALSTIEAEHGPLAAAIHGRGPMRFARFARASLSDAREMLSENLENGIALALMVLPGMRERGYGRLIYFGMTGSSVTRPGRGLALYGAAKAGLVAFARTLALEEGVRGITVNVIEPGDIREKGRSRSEAWAVPARNPSGHAGSWEDIADAVSFLLSYEAGFINGTVLAIGGGLTSPSEEYRE